MNAKSNRFDEFDATRPNHALQRTAARLVAAVAVARVVRPLDYPTL